uniref:Uncharacterized protein n=1 Tax=Triticum urartu TaxID=4572 RepID=A0A8R7U6C5_TRIUA
MMAPPRDSQGQQGHVRVGQEDEAHQGQPRPPLLHIRPTQLILRLQQLCKRDRGDK